MDNAFALLMTSKWEGYGLVCMEAAARGLPVIAFRVPGIREAVVDGKTGFLIDSDDDEGFLAAHRRLRSDTKLYASMSKFAASWANEYASPEAAAQCLETAAIDASGEGCVSFE